MRQIDDDLRGADKSMHILSKTIIGSTVTGADGYVGTFNDVLFSSDTWRVRYLLVDTGKWLPGRRVLLSPHAIERTDWPNESVFVRQTRQQIQDGPSLLEHEPISRQKEMEMVKYYGWPVYWQEVDPLMPGAVAGAPEILPPAVPEVSELDQEAAASDEDADLRSAAEISGYSIEASDGEIGHSQEFIVDDDAWAIRYLVVNTNRLLPMTSVLISPAWAEEVSWELKKVKLDLTREQVKGSPEFKPWEPVNRRYEERLYDYYGRPVYW